MLHQRNSLARLRLTVTALMVLLGVLAMHALAGGPHTPGGPAHRMAAEAGSAAGATVLPGSGMDPTKVHGAQSAVHVGTEAVSTLAAEARNAVARIDGALGALSTPTPPVPLAPSMAALCVALLLSLAVLLGPGLISRAAAASAPPSVPAPVDARRRLRRTPPPDLLTLNCVLRT